MSREALLRVVADRLDGSATLPSVIEGLAAPHVPSLYFHNATPAVLGPWLTRFGATFATVTDVDNFAGLPPFTVTTYRGSFRGLGVELRVSANR